MSKHNKVQIRFSIYLLDNEVHRKGGFGTAILSRLMLPALNVAY